jgi:hypothetical protein
LKKRSKKLLLLESDGGETYTSKSKVLWFFLSRKNMLTYFLSDACHPGKAAIGNVPIQNAEAIVHPAAMPREHGGYSCCRMAGNNAGDTAALAGSGPIERPDYRVRRRLPRPPWRTSR